MGLWDTIARAALNEIQNSINNHSFETLRSIGILFDRDYLPPFHMRDVRNEYVQEMLINSGKIIGIQVSSDNVEQVWMPFIDDGFWDAFVVTNGYVTVKYGLYGMGFCAILVEGSNAGMVAKNIAGMLEKLEFNDIRFYYEEIPFQQSGWLESIGARLESNFGL